MYSPKVSLIMPTFNHEKYIKKAVKTALKQTYKNLELIIIDDGSTDKTSKIINTFKDKRLKYIYQKNKGVKNLNKTINKGLNLAKGQLVTMITSDDFWPLDRLEKQIFYFKNYEVDMVFGNITLIDKNDNIIKYIKPNISNNFNYLNKSNKIKNYFINNYIPQPSTLIRMKSLKKIGGYIQKKFMYAEDYPTQLNIMINGKVLYIDDNFSFYRIHENQMTNLHTEKMILTDNKYLKQFYKTLNNKKKRITGIKNLTELNKILKNKIEKQYFYIGFKNACINKNLSAKKYFLKGIINGNSLLKIQCVIAMFLIMINFNFNILKKINIYKSIFSNRLKNYCKL